MKKYILASLALVLFTLTACKQKSRQEEIEVFRSELTEEDTVQMLKLCDDAMEQLKNEEIEQVLATLHEYNDSTEEITPLREETRKRYENTFKMFPVLKYRRIYYSFQLEGCNDVKYDVTFATARDAGTKEDAVTSYMFNPVKKDGEWYLCVKTAQDKIDYSKQ